jgi:hypothetical protein
MTKLEIVGLAIVVLPFFRIIEKLFMPEEKTPPGTESTYHAPPPPTRFPF